MKKWLATLAAVSALGIAGCEREYGLQGDTSAEEDPGGGGLYKDYSEAQGPGETLRDPEGSNYNLGDEAGTGGGGSGRVDPMPSIEATEPGTDPQDRAVTDELDVSIEDEGTDR